MSDNPTQGISKGAWWGGVATLIVTLALAVFHLDATITNHEDRLSIVEKRQDKTELTLDRLIETQTTIAQQQAVMNATFTATLTSLNK